MRIVYEEWFKRMPNVRLDPAQPAKYITGIVFAVERLPLVWN
jgi:hypothetical protein